MWQDVGADFTERGRIYLPQDEMRRFGVTETQIQVGEFTPAYRELLRDLTGRTRVLFAAGRPIENRVDSDLASTLRLFRCGGEAILDAIEAIDFNTLNKRPIVTRATRLGLLSGTLINRLAAALRYKGVTA